VKGEFKQRTKADALRVIKVAESLPKTGTGDVIGKQLLRSGTSIGANDRAACRGVEEEADESLYWMELLIDSGVVKERKLASLMKEVEELLAMTVSSIITMRSRKNPKSKIQNLKS
jgi:four helix bundle protein